MTREKLASFCGPSLFNTFSAMPMPAQLIRPCKPPKRASACATQARASASALTSVR